MGMIRDALIARAASDRNRPGSLPCPDVDNDGLSLGPGPEWTGSACTSYIGRVPWQTLDLPDLRDADGERFWYALSPAFRDSSAGGPLSSDTPGSLTVAGTPSATDVVAIIIAPGAPLPGQTRDPANTTISSELPQYLEGDNSNADSTYQAGPESSTFNDRLLVITRDMLMPPVEQRVARQTRRCLENFAASAGGRYPFAARMSDVGTYPDGVFISPGVYNTTNNYYGRIPSTLDATNAALGGTSYAWPIDDPLPGSGSTRCFQSGTWWDSWRELLLYRIAPAYLPSAATPGPCGTCLQVDGQGDVKFVVIVAGRALSSPSQTSRSTVKTVAQYYLEQYQSFDNAVAFTSPFAAFSFGKAPRAVRTGPLGGFNDRVECVRESGAPPCD